jgi:hypothetical protein
MKNIENLIRVLSKSVNILNKRIKISYERCFLDSGEYILNDTISSIISKEPDSKLLLPSNPKLGDYYIVENTTSTSININSVIDISGFHNSFMKETGVTTGDDFVIAGKSTYKFTALSEYNNKIVWRIEIVGVSINCIVDDYAYDNDLTFADLHNKYGYRHIIGFKVYCPNIVTGGKCYTLIDNIVETWVSESITKII